jgi:cytochrome c-type biogenesis protein CcmH
MRLLVVLVLLALPATALAATPKTTLPDVEDEVMCITCGTALNVSQAPSADRERAFIRRRIAEGLTKDQIKQRLVAEYGPKVLAEPHQETSWLVPVILGALALMSVGLTVRRWRRSAQFEPATELDPADNSRLERDMAGYDL